MHLLIISLGRLVANASAGHTVICGLVQAALDRGWEVSHLALLPADAKSDSWEVSFFFPKNENSLNKYEIFYSGLEVGKLKRYESTFNQAAAVCILDEGSESLLARNYDGVVAFDSLAVSLLPKVFASRKLVILGDPVGKRIWHSSTWAKPKLKLVAFFLGIAEIYFFSKLSSDIMISMFGTSHAKSWRRYLGRPVMDLRPFMPGTCFKIDSCDSNKRIIYFGGSLASTASNRSIDIISYGIMPALIQRFGEEGVELRLVGDCPDYFRDAVSRFKSVKIVGRVDQFEAELAKGEIFILPMDYPVGVRTRICSALAAGNVCLVHPSVLKNMPELAACPSVFLVEKPADYVKCVAALPAGRALLALRGISRIFFESHYVAPVAAKKLLDSLLKRN